MRRQLRETVLHTDELSLVLTSFLSERDCRSVRRISRQSLSECVSPRACRALAWRAKLESLFVTLEVALRVHGRGWEPLAELRSACAVAIGGAKDAKSEAHIEQVWAAARGMLDVRRDHCGLVLFQITDGETRMPLLTEVSDRLEQFEATLARESEALACGNVPSRALPAERSRRLSREGSICVPNTSNCPEHGVTPSFLSEHTRAFQRAREDFIQAKQWHRIVYGANVTCRHFIKTAKPDEKAEPDTCEKMARWLGQGKHHGDKALQTLEEQNSAIALLLLNGSGWITAEFRYMKTGKRMRLALAPAKDYAPVAAATCLEELTRELARLEARDGPVVVADAAVRRSMF